MDLCFVYCEGAHDLAFISKLLESNAGFTKSKLKVKDLPKIISGLIRSGIDNIDIENVRVEKQIRPFIPQVIFKKNDIDKYILLYSLGGKTRISDAIDNISRSKDLHLVTNGNVNHCIVVDADYVGDDLGGLEESNKYIESCLKVVDNSFNLNYKNKSNNFSLPPMEIATYIITGECGEQGALEDLLLISIQDKDLLSFAETFHNTSIEASPELPCVKGRSKPIKSKLGSYTQLYEPGSSLAVGIASDNLIDISRLTQNQNAIDLCTLII